MRETTTLQLLGTPVLGRADGTAVKLRQKAYALAAVLYLEFRDRTRRATLADRVWEQSSPEQALTNLRQTLLHTRDLEAKFGFELFDADATEIETADVAGTAVKAHLPPRRRTSPHLRPHLCC